MEDLRVEALSFKKRPYTVNVIEISCVLAFRSDAITRYADVNENSDLAFELRRTMEAIHKEVEENGESPLLSSKDGKYRLIYEMERSFEYYITDTNGKRVNWSGAYVQYGDRYITALAPWATSYGWKRAEEERQKQEEKKKREEKAFVACACLRRFLMAAVQ